MIPFIIVLLTLGVAFSKDLVLVSVYPFYDVVRGIGEGRFRSEVLIPPKADYHLYELSVSDVLKVSKAKAVFVTGVPLGGWEKKVEELSKGKAFRLSEGMELVSVKNHDGAVYDPHLWLSPERMIRVARNVFDALLKIDPQGRPVLETNLKRVLHRLEELDTLYRRTLSSCRHRTLPTVHASLGYLAHDYGLEQLTLGSGGSHWEISPKNLGSFVERLKEKRIDFILSVYGEPSKVEEVLRKEYGVRVFELNVKIIPADGREDYFSIMEYNLSVLREALECM